MKPIIKPTPKVFVVAIILFIFFCFAFFRENFLASMIHSTIVVVSLALLAFIECEILVRHLLFKGKPFTFYFITVVFVLFYSYLNLMSSFKFAEVMNISIPFNEATGDTKRIAFIIPYLTRLFINTLAVFVIVVVCYHKKDLENLAIQNELKNETLKMELSNLKSQINPHFLFNALNNVYSLVYIKDDKAPESILKLSEMMRYVMVDCQNDTISIEKEFKYIDNYIDFQLMKIENKPNIIFEKNIENPSMKILPMILQPIVENAFKYSRIDKDPDGFISLSFTQKGKNLKFIAKNSIKSSTATLPDDPNSTKIGLANIEKRMNMFYNGAFEMKTSVEDNIFTLTLTI